MDRKRQLAAQKCHTMYTSLRSVHPFFAKLTLLPNPQNPMLYNDFQSVRHSKCPFPSFDSPSCHLVSLCAAPSRHVDERRRLLSTESLLVERKYRTATLPSCNTALSVHSIHITWGGSVAYWLGRWTCNTVVASSIPGGQR